MCMLSLIGNIIVLNLHHRDLRIENGLPKWVNNIFLVAYIPVLLTENCMGYFGFKYKKLTFFNSSEWI